MTFSTSAVAVCCCSDWRNSFSSRAFFDGNDGLRGEGPEKRYLLVRKRVNFGTSKLECSDRHPLTQQWHTSDRPMSEPPCHGASFGKVLGLRLEVNYMNGLPLENDAACNTSTRARETKAL